MNSLAIALHGLAAAIWVGGMFFAYVVLRPSVALMEPHRRLTLWAGAFKRFFPWVWMSVVILPVTGYGLVFGVFGGFATSPVYVHIMHLLGLLMIALFVYMYYRPYALFKQTVEAEDWQAAGAALNRVRHVVLVNLVMGLILLALVYAGRYGLF
ncbi:CopD family protein [Granulosicoccus antarcticus]|uniref:Copper resistance protein D domain-containing protein n=1 Tax=Granulosicoccus antarcticus IMCC3135 TaxID=1192854 RepID=A0A2Z2NMY3_9GAMM|nr:CopD family protein [Granulosicoccus antarcticus]ASJ71271.1 hypothetical protein IMCC3135_05795 [Granulosicoccus antarcticus IMCC3135]